MPFAAFIPEEFTELLHLHYQCSLCGKSNQKGSERLRFSLFNALLSVIAVLHVVDMQKTQKQAHPDVAIFDPKLRWKNWTPLFSLDSPSLQARNAPCTASAHGLGASPAFEIFVYLGVSACQAAWLSLVSVPHWQCMSSPSPGEGAETESSQRLWV